MISFEESYLLQLCKNIWIIPKGKFWYFKWFCMCSLHSNSRIWWANEEPYLKPEPFSKVHFLMSFEESYLLQSCNNIWIIPKGKFWYFKWFCMCILHSNFQIWWENEEPYLLLTCIWNLNHSQSQVLVVHLFQLQSMHQQVHLLMSFEGSYLLQSCKNIWIIQRQVLLFQMILYVYFALKLSDLVREWRTAFIAYMHLKPKTFPKASLGS